MYRHRFKEAFEVAAAPALEQIRQDSERLPAPFFDQDHRFRASVSGLACQSSVASCSRVKSGGVVSRSGTVTVRVSETEFGGSAVSVATVTMTLGPRATGISAQKRRCGSEASPVGVSVAATPPTVTAATATSSVTVPVTSTLWSSTSASASGDSTTRIGGARSTTTVVPGTTSNTSSLKVVRESPTFAAEESGSRRHNQLA